MRNCLHWTGLWALLMVNVEEPHPHPLLGRWSWAVLRKQAEEAIGSKQASRRHSFTFLHGSYLELVH